MCYLLKVLYQKKQNQCQQFLDNFIKITPDIYLRFDCEKLPAETILP